MTDVNIQSNVENLELFSDAYPFRLSLRVKNFDSEASYKKFVRNCEAIVRKSVEYKLWKGYIIDVLQINECMITHEKMDEVTIEVHHHVPSLYVLIAALVNQKIDKDVEFCTFEICQEAIEIHFKNKIGYVTLLKSMHEKFHNGRLDIPIELVKGDYLYFLNTYGSYIDETDMDSINLRRAMTLSNCSWSRDNYNVATVGA